MARYGQAFKDKAVARLLPPESADVAVVSRDLGVSVATLERWRADALASGRKNGGWTATARFEAVLTTASMSEEARNAWCRSQGLYPSELDEWRAAAVAALDQSSHAGQAEDKADRRRVRELERELRRKDKALAEAAALLVLSKKGRGDLPSGRGRMIVLEDRQRLIRDIEAARAAGARLRPACALAGIDPRTVQRWHDGAQIAADRRPTASHPRPAHALSQTERARILAVVNEPRFAQLPPGQIVPRLADEGIYLASERSLYRVMHAADQVTHRGRAKAPQMRRAPTTHTSHGPGEVWCWDVTWLPALVAGRWFYLYLIIDLYSRKIVGHEVHEADAAEHATELLKRTALAEGIHAALHKPNLHGDNGASLKATTVLAMLQWLGIKPSYSRPRVSDDNAFVESLFRTAKFRPGFPAKGFADLDHARRWAQGFVDWYNHEHQHSGLRYVSPDQRHRRLDAELLQRRHALYQQARSLNPRRWSRQTRNWQPIGPVTLNPERDQLAMCSKPAAEQTQKNGLAA
ncbi:MAG: IS3 family transposase [Lysobacterales bacterium]